MSDLLTKCNVCGAVLDEEDLFCSECGTEAPLVKPAHAPLATHFSTSNFICDGCGASMSYDARVGTLRCPFCGSEKLTSQPDGKEIAPREIVPFAFDRAAAEAKLRQWLSQGFWRPGDLSEQASIVALQAVLVPYWVFAADTETFWTADTDQTPPGASANWAPVSGEHRGHYGKMLVGTSSALTPAEMAALGDYDLEQAVPPEKIDLRNVTYERFSVPRRYARPLARRGLEQHETAACTALVPGRARNVKVNVRITELTSFPVLMPAWVMAYRYRDQVFRFLINGQTGKAIGKAPLSYKKIGVALLIALAVIAAIFVIAAGR